MKPGIDTLREVIQERLEEKRRKNMGRKTSTPPQIRETDKGKEKWCSKGSHYQPADSDHFYRDAKSSTGLSSWCRDCQSSAVAAAQKKKAAPQTKLVPVKKNHAPETKPAPAKKDMVLHLDFSEHELLFEDIQAKAADQLRTPAMQAMWLASESLYKERNTTI